jgi:hypothetical protein
VLELADNGWAVRSAVVIGPLVLKGGAVSKNPTSRESAAFGNDRFREARLDKAPAWVQEIIAWAPNRGETSVVTWTEGGTGYAE